MRNMVTADAISDSYDDWLQKAGVVKHGIEGAMLLQIPEATLLTARSAMSNAAFATEISQHGHNLNQEQVLCIHVLHEASKASQSFWQHYIAQLPTDYALMMAFEPQHIQALQVQQAQTIAQAASARAKEHWSAAQSVLQHLGLSSKWCSLAAWLWAASTVCSRTMHVPFSSAGALAPFGDLHNYQPPPAPHYPEIDGVNVTTSATTVSMEQECGDGGYHEAFKEYCLYARRRYQPGEQVFLCYGKYTNLELLEHYGFTLTDNPHDEAEIPVTAFPPHVASFLDRQSNSQYYLHCNGIPSWQLLQKLRHYMAPPAERKKLGHLAAAGMRISIAGDVKVFQALQKACLTTLQGLETSLKQDVGLLQEAASDPCLHAAITWRMCYKRCLHKGYIVADEALCWLHSQPT